MCTFLQQRTNPDYSSQPYQHQTFRFWLRLLGWITSSKWPRWNLYKVFKLQTIAFLTSHWTSKEKDTPVRTSPWLNEYAHMMQPENCYSLRPTSVWCSIVRVGQPATEQIMLDGMPIEVRQDLFTAFWHLRSESETKVLWINAIYIYFNRYRAEYHGNLTFGPLFSEGFRFASRINISLFIRLCVAVVRFIRMRKQIHDYNRAEWKCNAVIFSLIWMIRKQKGAVLCHTKYMGCPPIELINHPAY
jgi:hypothetical protein